MQEQTITVRNPQSANSQNSYVEKLIANSTFEVFQETKNLLTLKKCMSREEVINAIFEVLDFTSNDDEAILLSFRLLAALLIRNRNDVLVIFERLNGYQRLE